MAEAAIGRLGGPRAARSSDPMLCKGALNPEEECWLSVLPSFLRLHEVLPKGASRLRTRRHRGRHLRLRTWALLSKARVA